MEDEAAEQQQSSTAFAASFFHLLHHYSRLLLKFWWIPVLLGALAVGVQWWLLKRVSPTFVSAGRMIVNVKLSIPNANVYSEELNNFFGTQAALMQSDSVVQRVRQRLQASRPELQPIPVKLSVTPAPKTSIFDLQAVAEDPAYAQAFLQATMDEYIALKKELLSHATTATQAALEEQLKQMATGLEACKQEIMDYQTSNSVVFLQPPGGNSAANRLAALNQQLSEKRSEMELLKTLTLDQNLERIQGLFTMPDAMTNTVAQKKFRDDAEVSAGVQNQIPRNLGKFEESYLQTKQQLYLLRGQRDELTNTLAPTAGQIVALNQEIAVHERLLEIYKKESEGQLQNRRYTLELEIRDLENQVSEWESKALDVSKKLADFDALKEKYQRLQAQYDQLQGNLQTLDVNKGIGQESVTILEPATWAVPVLPQTKKHLVMAGLIGLFLSLGLLLLIDMLNDRPTSFVELERLFDLPVLGQIPFVKSRKRTPAILHLEDNRYPLVEANRSLRSALLYKDALNGEPAHHPKIIVITSAAPNDGKSVTAANFAITLAEAGAKVLLIDADLRRGVLHQYFQMSEGAGLADVLAGSCDWSNAIVATTVPNLSLVPAGSRQKLESVNLFAMVGPLLDQIAEQYDHVIVDTVPVMVADDVLSLAPHADGVLLVIRAGHTSGRMARAALNLLRQRRVNMMGLVFNAIPPSASDYHNYRFKEYYQQR